MGAVRLSDISRALEHAAREGSVETAPDDVERAIAAFEQLRTTLSRELAEMGAGISDAPGFER